ncbi:pyrrolidone-carboxylate peptidase [Actinocatenispora thailandica]|uniref:Pyrrolidone-carboxylate peptidase n=1 Tax=Actinocatenispora thailandica TaxID=227318 RepID=A0A7R7DWL4_9ACTN|nr:pyroglutamyl-peptidase I [Actinocatenispora thailandica]BCJ38717.1 pyrrolidone-carboxylate peptidase [Actinocatenispora thailandica]
MSVRVLVTGFEPFGGSALNPSWAAASTMDGVDAVELPCTFGGSIPALRAAIRRYEPELVLCTGLAGGRTGLSVERVAINVDDARIADNAGAQPIDEPIVPGGPAAYFSSLPIKACVAALREAGIPAAVSQTAGTFVCNHVFYGLAHLIATEFAGLRGGFVHVPYAPEQVTDAAAPSMPVADIARGLGVVVDTALSRTVDLVVSGGAER